MNHEPKTLVEAVRYFADPDTTLKTIIELRWPNGVTSDLWLQKGPVYFDPAHRPAKRSQRRNLKKRRGSKTSPKKLLRVSKEELLREFEKKKKNS